MKDNLLKIFLSAILIAICSCASARTYLVSVGIADYSAFPKKVKNLGLTVADAKAMAELYAGNGKVDYALLLNSNATKGKILSAIKKVFGAAGPDDIVVFFFSGHGYNGGLCAYDGTIDYETLRKAMSKSKCKNKMMFVDACRSGGLRVNDRESQNAVASVKKGNVMLFLSSRTNENSIEMRNMKNGFFTTYLTRGLRGNADVNRDKIITAKELFDFVHEGVSQISQGRQHPVMWGNFNDNMPVMKW